jgi:hypothetical protein
MEGIGGLRTLAQPVVHAGQINVETLGLGAGIVGADGLDRIAITTRTGFGDNHAVMRLMGGANAGETDFKCHVQCFSERYLFGKAVEQTAR